MSRTFCSFCDQILFRLASDSSKNVSSEKYLSHLLNQLTEYVAIASHSADDDQTIVFGLQMLLLTDVERVRAASLRALRFSIHRPTIFEKFLQFHLDYLVCRSLVIDNRNDRERLETLKLIRRIFKLYPEEISPSFIYALDSIVALSYNDSSIQSANPMFQVRIDPMIKCSLEFLCEIAVTNPLILHECRTLDTMLKYIVDFNQDEIIESVIYALLKAIDRFSINDNSETVLVDSIDPDGPSFIFVDEGMRERHHLIRNIFNQLVVIFSMSDQGKLRIDEKRGMIAAISENSSINHIRIFRACSTALRTILHSWIGKMTQIEQYEIVVVPHADRLITVCELLSYEWETYIVKRRFRLTVFSQTKNSSIRLLVNCLLMQSEIVQISIIDLFFELLNFDVPPMTDNFQLALKSIHPTWNLTGVDDGFTFVASEGNDKLPRLSTTRPNLLDSHTALLLLTLVDAGFIEAVSELVSSHHSILSVRATLLLSNFVWLCNEHLPEEQSFLLLPLLMDSAIADGETVKRSLSKEAIFRMNEYFQFKKRFYRQCSFQLSQLVFHAQRINDYFTLMKNIANESSRRTSNLLLDDPLEAENIDHSIRDTNTLQNKNFRKWNWDLILSLLKDFPQLSNRIQGDLYERFLDKLFDFFNPEEKFGFRSILLTDRLSDVTCRSLLAFADLLIYPTRASSNHIRSIASDIARSFLQSVSNALKQSIVGVRDGTGQNLFTDQDLLSSNTVYYYLFLGRLTKSSIGTQVLHETDVFLHLSDMLKMDDEFVTSTVVALSSFNYYYDGPCRTYLGQALKSSCSALRIYTTKLLRVILRCNPVAFGQWGLTFLSTQLLDTNHIVVTEAVSILDEALEDKRLVSMFHKQWDKMSSLENRNSYLHEIYHLACSRLCSIPFQQVLSEEKHLLGIEQELSYWDKVFNRRYVTIMETRLFTAYSGGALLTDDYFERRKMSSNQNRTKRRAVNNIHVSAHIYRQLSLHHDGFEYLRRHSRLESYARDLSHHATNCVEIQEAEEIKEALWALGHTASTNIGFNWFITKDLLAHFLRFAEECQNLSVRGTAFYTLSLIAQTPDGAMSLKDFGWETYRVRAHSISTSVANTDTYQGTERRMSRAGTISPPNQSPGIVSLPPIIIPSSAGLTKDAAARRFDWKSRRASTTPANAIFHSTEYLDSHNAVIFEETGPPTPTNNTVTVSFSDPSENDGERIVITVPIRRNSILSKELAELSTPPDTSIIGSDESSMNPDRSRSSSYQTHTSYNPSQSVVSVPSGESLPLERYCPRLKSAHQSNRLRQLKQLEKVPQVIQSLQTPGSSDDIYRSRTLRCNFLLKPDAAGYDYARRVQELSHATYSYALKSNAHIDSSPISFKQKDEQCFLPVNRTISEFDKKISELYYSDKQTIERFSLMDGKFSLDEVDFDDADQDGNTIYRGLALPVDVRQVVEISNGLNLNYETWSDLARSRSRSRSRANTTNIDLTRGRSGTNGSTGSAEFIPLGTSPIQMISSQDLSTNSSPLNICMMCINSMNGTTHENEKFINQKEFSRIKYLANRLMVNIDKGDIERELLSFKQRRPELFDNICLYSEICYLFSVTKFRIAAQRFLHDLFSDCQFQTFRQRYQRHANTLVEEDDELCDSDESLTDVE